MEANSFPRTIFVLGTARDIGKTVTCIGIIAKLLSDYGYTTDQIGYMKPVGQETLTVLNGEGVPIQADKDAVLLTSLMDVQSHGYENVSPVVWQGGLTAECIDAATRGDPRDGQQAFFERIFAAYLRVAEGRKFVVLEGTGQPGVGSVAGISNADVINMLRARGVPLTVLIVSEAGIGNTIDQLFPYLMTLDHMGTRVDGIIINDVLVNKLDQIKRYLSNYYTHSYIALYGQHLTMSTPPPLLGFVPSMPELRYPTMRLIAETLAKRKEAGVEVVAPEDFDTQAVKLVRNVKVINLVYGYEPYVHPGDAVIVGVNANEIALAMLLLHKRLVRQHGEGLSGLILSCKSVGGLSPQVRRLIEEESLPAIVVDYDSADLIKRVDNMTVKIQPYDITKRDLIVDTYCRHLTLEGGLG